MFEPFEGENTPKEHQEMMTRVGWVAIFWSGILAQIEVDFCFTVVSVLHRSRS
jgi:hypothetical protein